MKSDFLYITDAEKDIMTLLWQSHMPVTAAEIGLALPNKKWKVTTVHTLATQLEAKGIVKHYKVNGRKYYFALITETDYQFITTKDFINKTYPDGIVGMVRLLLCDCTLTSEELAMLRDLVNVAAQPSVAIDSATTEKDTCDPAAQPEILRMPLPLQGLFYAPQNIIPFYVAWRLWALSLVEPNIWRPPGSRTDAFRTPYLDSA